MAYNNRNYNYNNNNNYNNRNHGGRNNNGYRYNNGYDDNRNNYRPQYNENNRDDEYFFDATQFKRNDIKIKDLKGRTYIISGNFAEMYSLELAKDAERIQAAQKAAQENGESLESNIEIINIMKEWTLGFLKYDTTGEPVTMEDITRGFDVRTMLYLLREVTAFVGKQMGQDNGGMKVI